MKRKLHSTILIISFLVILSLPCLVHATVLGTAEITQSGFYANSTISVWGSSLSAEPVNAGIHRLYKSGSTGEGDIWSDGYLGAVCIELSEPYSNYPFNYDVIMPSEGPLPVTTLGSAMGTEKAKYLQELWGRYYDPGWATGTTFTTKENNLASIFAAAVWEIVYEDFSGNPLDWDVTSDGSWGSEGFMAIGLDSAIANEWLHSLDGTGPMADLRVLSLDGYQDFLVAVPEPTTIVLLGLGSALGLMRRKKKVC